MTGDPDLLRQFLATRSDAAFAELVERHLSLVYFTALRLLGNDAHAAHDVAQSVFTDLARKAASLTDRPTLTGWLHRSTRYAAAKWRRAEASHRRKIQDAMLTDAVEPGGNATIDWNQLRPVIDETVNDLNERDRDAVLLRFFEGASYATIGRVLNVSEDAARMRVERALEKLRTALIGRGVTSTSAALALALTGKMAVAAPAGMANAITASALANAATSGSASTAATLFMSVTKLQLGIATAIFAGVLAAFMFHSGGNLSSKAAVTPTVSGSNSELISDRVRRQTAPKPPAPVAYRAPVEPGRKAASDHGIRASRAAALEIVSNIYAPLLEKLHVSGAVRTRFLELVCDERQAAFDVVSVAGANHLSYLTDPTVERMALQAATSADADIRTLLTPEEFDRFIDYRNLRTIQVSVSRVAEQVSETGGPQLTATQVQGLIKIFFDTQTPGQLRRAPINAVLNLGGAGITEPIIRSARAILSDQQLAALLAVRDGQLTPPHDVIGAGKPTAGAR